MTNRRVFILQSFVASSVLAHGAANASNPMMDDTTDKAKVMGYVSDTTKANKAKYPKHNETQTCSGCSLWQGKAGDASGNCPLYPGNQTAAKGWCSAYVKKA